MRIGYACINRSIGCTAPWREVLAGRFAAVGTFARRNDLRISMHPDQFNLPNAKDPAIVERTVAELTYRVVMLDLLGLGRDAKVQVHVGGLYGDRQGSTQRFIDTYGALYPHLRRRLVIKNDDGRYSIADCLAVSNECAVPVVLDVFHHSVYGGCEPIGRLLDGVASTWVPADGLPTVDHAS